MPRKDERLYAKFTLDFADSPKIAPLSDAAFRTLVEMTLWSRRMLTDGFVPKRVASKFWQVLALAELCQNDTNRPSLIETDDGYQIHDFTEHQTTKADIEAKKEAGRLGGLAKAGKTVAPATETLEQTSSKHVAKTETETETESKELLSNEKPLDSERQKIVYPEDFEQWWKSYPRRESKGDALKAWKQLKKDRILPDLADLIAAAQAYELRETRPGFRKLPAGWLRDHKWVDEAAVDPAAPVEDTWAAYRGNRA